VAVVLLVGDLSAVRAQDTGATLRVLTWNIHSEDPDHLAEVIGASGADVVALQEVDAYQRRSGCRDQAADIAAHLGMEARYGANITSGEECGDGQAALYGDALLSRHPILEWRHVPLPNRGGEPRGLLEVVLEVAGRRVRVVSTHLEYASGSERKAQAEAVVEHLQGSAEPVVVMGDLNGEPDDSGLAPLRDAFTDAWAAAGDGDGFTNPARDPRRRIDYVFFRGLSPTRVEVVDSTASDHLAVRADLVL
jgi:endonuclease/exonuclease/phosphatase family metal-dependent hydrolase